MLSSGILAGLLFFAGCTTCFSPAAGAQAGGRNEAPQTSSPAATLRTYTRMVNLEVVAKDAKGNHIQGLKAEDFQIEEQTPDKGRKQSRQTIAGFREMHMASMAAPAPAQAKMPPGEFTNAVAVSKDPAPPTILLVDGLNTPVEQQAQVHVQMLKMLRQLPANVPVAVFLLGGKLTLLQGFTSDPKFLQAALSNVTSAAGAGIATVQPQDDPGAPGNSMSGIGSSDPDLNDLIAAAQNFDKAVYAAQMDERVNRTANALESIARSAAGYPGRKNLLWLSTAFPIAVEPVAQALGPDNQRLYFAHLQRVNEALSDAKVSVYPVNVAGVTNLAAYQAGTRPPEGSSGGDVRGSVHRQELLEQRQDDTMQVIAEGTGGKVCTGDNDLGDCVRKAVDDSSDFYEISYYSNSTDWNGEFRRISVKTGAKGAHLSYRQGYFATPEGGSGPKGQSQQLQSDCENYLDATAIPFTAATLPADAPGQMKFSLLVDAAALTLRPNADGKVPLDLAIGVCTYNEKGWPLKLMNYPVSLLLDAGRYQTLLATGKLADTIRIPAPQPAAIRLLVKDVPTGRLGSIYISTHQTTAPN